MLRVCTIHSIALPSATASQVHGTPKNTRCHVSQLLEAVVKVCQRETMFPAIYRDSRARCLATLLSRGPLKQGARSTAQHRANGSAAGIFLGRRNTTGMGGMSGTPYLGGLMHREKRCVVCGCLCPGREAVYRLQRRVMRRAHKLFLSISVTCMGHLQIYPASLWAMMYITWHYCTLPPMRFLSR